MCNFLSALVLRNGDVLTHPMLDSHSDLVRYFKLPDGNAHIHHFAKVELVPENDWTDAATWNWSVDEDVLPSWWGDVAAQAEATLRARAARMVLKDGERELIVGGCWIVAGTAKVRDVRSGRIMRVQGLASIRDVWGSASIRNVGDSASIRDVWGSASIRNVGDSASIRDVGGSASISNVGDSASISNVGGSASIRDVWGSASIRDVGDSASIRDVGDSASISNVGDLASIRDVGGSASIRNVGDSVQTDDSAKAAIARTAKREGAPK